MRLFFVIFILFFFLLPGFPEAGSCAGKEKGDTGHTNATFSPPERTGGNRILYVEPHRSTASAIFASRTKLLIRNIFQNKPSSSLPYSIVPDTLPLKKGAEILKIKESSTFLALTIPAEFSFFYMDKDAMYRTVSFALLAEAGISLRFEKDFRRSFLVAAIVHECLNHIFLASMPYSKYDPFSSVLASYGFYPTLRELLYFPPDPASPAAGIYEEYSSHLLASLLRNRFFSGADFLSVARETAQKGADRQYAVLSVCIAKNLQKNKKTEDKKPDIWFQKNLKRLLLSSLMPASPHYIEKEYIKNAVFTGIDRNGKMQRYSLGEFAKAVKELQDPDFATYQFLQFLLHHARIAPGDSRNALLYLRQMVIKTRKSPTKANQILLVQAEKNLFLQLEKIWKMEKFLRKTERMTTTAGVRFFQTMPLLDKFHSDSSGTPWGSRMEKLLNDTQKTYFADERNF